METQTCDRCGSVYELSSWHSPMRDKDSIECEVCGATLKRWNGSRVWTAKLVKRGTPHGK